MPKLFVFAALFAAILTVVLVAAPTRPATAGESNLVCESTSWGNDSEGGSQTVCADLSTGDGSWDIREWGDGYRMEDTGSVTTNDDGSQTIVSKFSDETWAS